MKVSELMTRDVQTCRMEDTLDVPAQIMWTCDCGCVPVLDDASRVVGMITDRDICMAALSQRRVLDEIEVAIAASTSVATVRVNDPIDAAVLLMRQNQVRRIPVTNADGRLEGILSMTDLAKRAERSTRGATILSGDSIAQTLAAVGTPRQNVQRAQSQGL